MFSEMAGEALTFPHLSGRTSGGCDSSTGRPSDFQKRASSPDFYVK